jgi:hypothetical protein
VQPPFLYKHYRDSTVNEFLTSAPGETRTLTPFGVAPQATAYANSATGALFIIFVPRAGVEPARSFEHTLLKRACLPIPAPRHRRNYIKTIENLTHYLNLWHPDK